MKRSMLLKWLNLTRKLWMHRERWLTAAEIKGVLGDIKSALSEIKDALVYTLYIMQQLIIPVQVSTTAYLHPLYLCSCFILIAHLVAYIRQLINIKRHFLYF
jgi:hypothetical protein